ncbi:MAG TPA: hypothetical protein VF613_24605 [Longimicrobium sp.]|jgi:hypothetical protein
MPQSFDPRDARNPGPARVLGPYETAYDVRRGYGEPAETRERPVRHDETETWRGRGRDER